MPAAAAKLRRANCRAKKRLLWWVCRTCTESRTSRWSWGPLSCCAPWTSRWSTRSVSWTPAWSGGRSLETRTPNESESVCCAVSPSLSPRLAARKLQHHRRPGNPRHYWAQGRPGVRQRNVEPTMSRQVADDHLRRCRELARAAWAEEVLGFIAPRWDPACSRCLVPVQLCTGMIRGSQNGPRHLLGVEWREEGILCLAIDHPHVVDMGAVHTTEIWRVNWNLTFIVLCWNWLLWLLFTSNGGLWHHMYVPQSTTTYKLLLTLFRTLLLFTDCSLQSRGVKNF